MLKKTALQQHFHGEEDSDEDGQDMAAMIGELYKSKKVG